MLNQSPDTVTDELLERAREAAGLLDRIRVRAAEDAAGLKQGIDRREDVLRVREEEARKIVEPAEVA
jgi:hypothetical protein